MSLRLALGLISLAAIVLTPERSVHGQGARDGGDIVDVTITEGTMFTAIASPDRRSIAIDLLGAIWVLPIEGGTAQRLTPDDIEARRPTWAPDSRSIAFQGYANGWHIYAIGPGTPLTALTSGPFDDEEPDWSHDGQRIAFSSDRSGGFPSIFQLDVSTRTVQRLSTWRGTDPCWSPSDHEVVFWGGPPNAPAGRDSVVTSVSGRESFEAGGRNDRSLSQAPCGNGRTFAQVVSLSPAEDVFPFPPQWLRSGELLYTADGHIKRRAGGASPDLVPFRASLKLRRAIDSRAHRDLDPTDPRPALGIVHPAVSADGKKIAFEALGDLWILTPGQAPVQLTNDPALEIDPSWSPDGMRLAFASDRAGHMDLWIHDFRSRGDVHVTTDNQKGTVSSPSWSPDGQQIAYLVNRTSLYVVDVSSVAGAPSRAVAVGSRELGRPTWPPDSKRIAAGDLLPFATLSLKPEGINQLTVFPLSGSPKAAVLTPYRSAGDRINNGPVWSPDGRRMAYVAEGSLWVIPVDADGAGFGMPIGVADEWAESPSWEGDSEHIVYLAAAGLKRVAVNARKIETIPIGIGWKPMARELTVVHAGALFDGVNSDLRQNVDIVIDRGNILAVEPHQDGLHATGRVIDASNETVMPGLIDMHAHLDNGYGEALGRVSLAYGVTAVRDPEADAFIGLEQREAYDAGRRIGPRVFLGANPLTGARVLEAGATSVFAEPQLMQELERGFQLQYDVLATYERLPNAFLRRATEYAHAQNRPVASRELLPGVTFGVDTLEGLRGVDRRGLPSRVTRRGRSYQDVIAVIARSNIGLVPMLGASDRLEPAGAFVAAAVRDASVLDDPRMTLLPPSRLETLRAVVAYWKEHVSDGAQLDARMAAWRRTVRAIVEQDGRVLAGSGAPASPYGIGLHVELQQLVEAGLTPYRALQSATIHAAESLGVDDVLGSIEAGKAADLVIVGGDPLRDIKNARDVRAAIRGGRYYPLGMLLGR